MFFRLGLVGLISLFWVADFPRYWLNAGLDYLPTTFRVRLGGAVPTFEQALGRLTAFDISNASLVSLSGRAAPSTGAAYVGARGFAALPPELSRVWTAPVFRTDLPVPAWTRQTGKVLMTQVGRQLDSVLQRDRKGRL